MTRTLQNYTPKSLSKLRRFIHGSRTPTILDCRHRFYCFCRGPVCRETAHSTSLALNPKPCIIAMTPLQRPKGSFGPLTLNPKPMNPKAHQPYKPLIQKPCKPYPRPETLSTIKPVNPMNSIKPQTRNPNMLSGIAWLQVPQIAVSRHHWRLGFRVKSLGLRA